MVIGVRNRPDHRVAATVRRRGRGTIVGQIHGQARRRRRGTGRLRRAVVGRGQVPERHRRRGLVDRQGLRDRRREIVVTVARLARGDRRRTRADDRHRAAAHRRHGGVGTGVAHGQVRRRRRSEVERGVEIGLRRQRAKRDGLVRLRDHQRAGDRTLVVVVGDRAHHRITAGVGRRRRGAVVGEVHRQARGCRRGARRLRGAVVGHSQIAECHHRRGLVHGQRLRDISRGVVVAATGLARGDRGRTRADDRHRSAAHRRHGGIGTGVAHREVRRRRRPEGEGRVVIDLGREGAERDRLIRLRDNHLCDR